MQDDLPETPNCPQCLVMMVLGGSEDNPRWVCPECGLARIA